MRHTSNVSTCSSGDNDFNWVSKPDHWNNQNTKNYFKIIMIKLFKIDKIIMIKTLKIMKIIMFRNNLE